MTTFYQPPETRPRKPSGYKIIRISFPKEKELFKTYLESIKRRMEVLLEQKCISKIPTLRVVNGNMAGYSVVEIACFTDHDEEVLFGFYQGIDFIRNNLQMFKDRSDENN